jgi:hypothetical protein
LRFIIWSFLKARLQFILDQFNGATSERAQLELSVIQSQLRLRDLLE